MAVITVKWGRHICGKRDAFRQWRHLILIYIWIECFILFIGLGIGSNIVVTKRFELRFLEQEQEHFIDITGSCHEWVREISSKFLRGQCGTCSRFSFTAFWWTFQTETLWRENRSHIVMKLHRRSSKIHYENTTLQEPWKPAIC